MNDYQYFRGKPVPQLKQRQRVEWILKTARDSEVPRVSSNCFIYDFRIPRISAHIFNMREDLWEIETTKNASGIWYYELINTPQEILEQAKTERLFQ